MRSNQKKGAYVVNVLFGDLGVRCPAAPERYSLVDWQSLRASGDDSSIIRAVFTGLHGVKSVLRAGHPQGKEFLAGHVQHDGHERFLVDLDPRVVLQAAPGL